MKIGKISTKGNQKQSKQRQIKECVWERNGTEWKHKIGMNGCSNRSITKYFCSLFCLLCAIWKENDFHSPISVGQWFSFSFSSTKIQRITGIMNLFLFESWHKIRQIRWITLFLMIYKWVQWMVPFEVMNTIYAINWDLNDPWAYIHLNIHNFFLHAYTSHFARCPLRPYLPVP